MPIFQLISIYLFLHVIFSFVLLNSAYILEVFKIQKKNFRAVFRKACPFVLNYFAKIGCDNETFNYLVNYLLHA